MDDLTTFLDAWTVAERTGDAAATDRLLTHDFVGVGPLGFELDKPAWLAGGHPVPEAARTTLVAVDDGDGWRLAGIHYSFIAGTPGAPPVPGSS